MTTQENFSVFSPESNNTRVNNTIANSISKLQKLIEYESSVNRRTNTISNENSELPGDPRNLNDSTINKFITSEQNDPLLLNELLQSKLTRRESVLGTDPTTLLDTPKLLNIFNLLIQKNYEEIRNLDYTQKEIHTVLSEFGEKLGVSILEKLGGTDGGIVNGERADLHLVGFRKNGELIDITIFENSNNIPILLSGNLSVTYFRLKFKNRYIVDCEIVPSNEKDGATKWKLSCIDTETYDTVWSKTVNESIYDFLELEDPINLNIYIG
jgi:hypothetical protein